MKQQINHLRSGTKNQLLNPNIDYGKYYPSSSHVGHSGTNSTEVQSVWEIIKQENPESLSIELKGLIIILKAHWSKSRKSVSYHSDLPNIDILSLFSVVPAKNTGAYIAIHDANTIIVSNGKNGYTHICPSFITIL